MRLPRALSGSLIPLMPFATIEAAAGTVDLDRTALIIIDMQRDFLEQGGFGEALGNDVSCLAAAVEPCRAVLAVVRWRWRLVIHTREVTGSDLSDVPRAKLERGAPRLRIGVRRGMSSGLTSFALVSRTGASAVRKRRCHSCASHAVCGAAARQQTVLLDDAELPLRPIGFFTQPISFIGLVVVVVSRALATATDRRANCRAAVARRRRFAPRLQVGKGRGRAGAATA